MAEIRRCPNQPSEPLGPGSISDWCSPRPGGGVGTARVLLLNFQTGALTCKGPHVLGISCTSGTPSLAAWYFNISLTVLDVKTRLHGTPARSSWDTIWSTVDPPNTLTIRSLISSRIATRSGTLSEDHSGLSMMAASVAQDAGVGADIATGPSAARITRSGTRFCRCEPYGPGTWPVQRYSANRVNPAHSVAEYCDVSINMPLPV